MLSEGQEFARSKIISATDAPDKRVGQIDRDPYAKDNETNWLNFQHKQINHDLFLFYRGLIRLRQKYPAFRRTPDKRITFLRTETEYAIGFVLPGRQTEHDPDIFVLMNANRDASAQFRLPDGKWQMLSDGKLVKPDGFGHVLEGRAVLQQCSSVIFKANAT